MLITTAVLAHRCNSYGHRTYWKHYGCSLILSHKERIQRILGMKQSEREAASSLQLCRAETVVYDSLVQFVFVLGPSPNFIFSSTFRTPALLLSSGRYKHVIWLIPYIELFSVTGHHNS